jgi:hypothetical protein
MAAREAAFFLALTISRDSLHRYSLFALRQKGCEQEKVESKNTGDSRTSQSPQKLRFSKDE